MTPVIHVTILKLTDVTLTILYYECFTYYLYDTSAMKNYTIICYLKLHLFGNITNAMISLQNTT